MLRVHESDLSIGLQRGVLFFINANTPAENIAEGFEIYSPKPLAAGYHRVPPASDEFA